MYSVTSTQGLKLFTSGWTSYWIKEGGKLRQQQQQQQQKQVCRNTRLIFIFSCCKLSFSSNTGSKYSRHRISDVHRALPVLIGSKKWHNCKKYIAVKISVWHADPQGHNLKCRTFLIWPLFFFIMPVIGPKMYFLRLFLCHVIFNTTLLLLLLRC